MSKGRRVCHKNTAWSTKEKFCWKCKIRLFLGLAQFKEDGRQWKIKVCYITIPHAITGYCKKTVVENAVVGKSNNNYVKKLFFTLIAGMQCKTCMYDQRLTKGKTHGKQMAENIVKNVTLRNHLKKQE